MEEFTERVQALRPRLYRTALCYLGSEAAAMDAVDEAVYRGLKGLRKLREPAYFETWLTRILINECSREQKRRQRFCPLEDAPELTAEDFDGLPLREALNRLPQQLKQVLILRYFTGLTLAETAKTLELPQGTVVTRQRRGLQLLRLELEEETV